MPTVGRTVPTQGDAQSRNNAPRTGEDPFVAVGSSDGGVGSLVERLLNKWHVPGLAVAVVDGEKTWSKGYGFSNIDKQEPVTPSTLFYAGSTTKAFTAACIGRLIDLKTPTRVEPAKPLQWTTPISHVLPEDFVMTDDWATKHLTIEDALCHRTGLPSHDTSSPHRLEGGRIATVRDVARSLRHLKMNVEPRTKFQYCNLMFCVASHVVETLTGKWLGHVLREWIWEPLGMGRTYFSVKDAEESPDDFATGYYWQPDANSDSKGSFREVHPRLPTEEISGAGAIISNVEDYAKWIRCLLNEAAPLSKATHEAFRQPRILSSPARGNFDGPPFYALAWQFLTYRGHRVWTHSGGTDAFGTRVYFLPDQDFGVVTMGNTAGTASAVGDVVCWRLIEDRLGLAADERPDWEEKYDKAFSVTPDDARGQALKRFFPDTPQPPLKMSLPLERYAGKYFDPAYHEMTLTVANSADGSDRKIQLVAKRPNATWTLQCQFEHVSGEYWLMAHQMIQNPISVGLFGFAAVEFRLGANGKVVSMVVDMRDEASDETAGSVCFDRID